MKLKWTQPAWDAYEKEIHYLDTRNHRAARMLVRHIRAITDSLIAFPEMGLKGRTNGTRELFSTQYPFVIVYQIKPKGVVEIVAFLHTARKYPPEDE